MRYQWRFDDLDIYGANTATLLLPGFQFSQAGIYNVVVYNSGGSVLSANISLVARQGLKITSQPVDRVVTNGATVSFTNLAVIGTGILRYQWHLNGGPVLNASNGTTSSILVLTNVQVAHNGAYDCVVSDDFDTTNSLPGMLTVLIPPRFAVNPQSQIVALGSNATFNVSISGSPPLIFRWRRTSGYLTNGLFNGLIVSGSSDSTLTLTNLNATNAATYFVGVANVLSIPATGGSGSGFSSNAYLFVMLPPADQAMNAGGNAVFSTSLVGVTNNVAVSYQWQAPSGPLPGATNSTLIVSNVQPAIAGAYSVTVNITTNAYVTPATFSANLQALPSNTPPTLQAISDYTVDEQNLLTFSAKATDADVPAQALAFSLGPGAPPGASITPAGIFKWRPNEAQGPGVYHPTIQVTDSGGPNLTSAQTFTVTVREVNTPPVFFNMRDKYVKAGTLLSFPTATDYDLPPNNLSFSMNAASASGAAIDPASGIFSWTPSDAQAPGNYPVPIQVTDDGIPPLSTSATFTIHVLQSSATLIQISSSRSSNSVQLTWASTVGKTYQIQYQISPGSTWIPVAPNIVAAGTTSSFSETVTAARRFYRILELP